MLKALATSLEDWTLNWLAADPSAPEIGGTANYSIENCLHFVRKTVPHFDERIRGKRVLDYGCGFGWQAIAMDTQCGASHVMALDIVPSHFETGR